MSLNGWYKQTFDTSLQLYQFILDKQQVNINKDNASGEYVGYYVSNGIWVKYATQDAINAVWLAQFKHATPLPDNTVAKK